MSTQQRNMRKRNAEPFSSQTTPQRDRDSSSERQSVEQDADSHQHGGTDEYVLKRLRNNAAVSRTRQKKRMEQVHTSQRVKELREENAQLERTLDTMRRELALLKEMVVVCAAKGDAEGGRSCELSD